MELTGDRGGFGELLRACRRAAGLTQRRLAGGVGVSVAAIRDLEQGRTRRPQRRCVDAMITVLRLTGDSAAAFRRAAEDSDRIRPARQVDPDGPVRIRILGPLSVDRGAGPVPVGRGSRRAVLGRLALSTNATVPIADLVDLLWDSQPPPKPAHAVQVYLSRLRSALQPAGPGRAAIISRTAGGYQLNLADDQLDLAGFRRQVRLARTAEPAEALDMLETALALWYGSPLADLPQLHNHPLVTALAEEQIAATLRYADLALAAGQAERCLPRLRSLAAVSPLHEPLHARLITVLAAGNLQAAALAAYSDIRRRLVDDLGVEPGPELAKAHRRVLRQEPDLSPRRPPPASIAGLHPPAQLPADIRRFTGRVAALARLDGILDARLRVPAVIITAVSGTAGVGKTALAVHWAHRVRHRFPDGQFYINLRGFHPTGAALTAGEAVHHFLTGLGVPPTRIPADLDAQSALYRTLLADRRMLILLDNARDADQVRPLLPGAPGCLALITSRHRLTSLLAAEAAQPVPLDLLSHDEARDLLVHRLGADRTAAEPAAVETIVERCARLPLALAIAAARATTRPNAPLAHLAARLSDSGGRLDALNTGDPGTDVRAVFSWSYQMLQPAAARMFRLLGLQPGADISARASASLAGLSPPQTAAALAELISAHLLAEPTPGRYTFHDLLQAYAADRADDEDPAPVRRAALTRLFDHYRQTAEAAMRVLFPAEQQRRSDAYSQAPPFGGSAAARDWLTTERANLIAVAGHCATQGWPGHTTALSQTLYRYFDSGYYNDALVLHTHAYEAARHSDDRTAEARALNDIGIQHRRFGRFPQAADCHRRALTICRDIGDRSGEARGLSLLGVACWRLGRYRQSENHHLASLDLFREIGDQLGEANQLNAIGIGTRQTGQLPEAIGYHLQALALFRGLDDRLDEADTLDHLGTSHQVNGSYQQAIDCHRLAAAIFRELGYRPGEAHAVNNLGHTLLRLGQPSAAAEHHQHALTIYREIGERSYEIEALNGLGTALLAAGNRETAHDRYSTALTLADRTGDRHEQATAHNGLADTYHATGDTHRARHHWRHAMAIYTDLGLPEAALVRDKIQDLDRKASHR